MNVCKCLKPYEYLSFHAHHIHHHSSTPPFLHLSNPSFKTSLTRFLSIFPKKGLLNVENKKINRPHLHQSAILGLECIENKFHPSTHHDFDFKKHLYDMLKEEDGNVPVTSVLKNLSQMGLWSSDPRLSDMMEVMEIQLGETPKFNDFSEGILNQEEFTKVVACNPNLLKKVFTRDMIIPEFEKFSSTIETLFNSCKKIKGGKVAEYIPQLAKSCPDNWAVSICTIDGQRFSMGNDKSPFTMQSASKPLTYAVAVNELGAEMVHTYLGCEPSGESFNSIKLGPDLRPHNPMINLGAIVTSSMIKNHLSMGERFDFVQKQYSLMAGGELVSFNNSVYLSEKATANRNLALGYYLKEHNCFPPNTDLEETLDLYFMNCAIEINANSGAVIAGTLANGGYCPLTNDHVLSPIAVRNTLVLMHSCGMYDYSGNFSFKVGMPAKSSVSGVIILVVPNVMGICLWSPSLDSIGNSVKGVHFCEELVNLFNFHHYDSLVRSDEKSDPRRKKIDTTSSKTASLMFAANAGDFKTLRTLALHGTDMGASNYDYRTALHVAASEGHLECVKFLVERCRVDVSGKDRWERTALDDATHFDRQFVVEYLQSLEKRIY